MILAHLTDPHLPLGRPSVLEALGKRGLAYANWARNRRHRHRAEIAEKIVSDLESVNPDFIAMTGDLVNFSLDAEFAAGAEWLARLGSPERVGLIPGNHEALVRGFDERIVRHWRGYVSGDDGVPGFPWLRRRGEVAVIGVSSAIATPPFIAAGRVGARQTAALRRMLSDAGREGLFRLVLVHHPPTPITRWRKSLFDRRDVCQAIAAQGAELVLHGHTHRADLSWIAASSGKVPVVGAPSCSMAPGPGRDAGAWLRLDLRREGADWRLDLRERRIDETGGVSDGPLLEFHIPRWARTGAWASGAGWPTAAK